MKRSLNNQSVNLFELEKGKDENVVYICDCTACEECDEDGLCKHTTYIEHAINFKEISDGKYIEKENTNDQIRKRSLIIVKRRCKSTPDVIEKRRQEIIKQINEGFLYLETYENLEFCQIFDNDLEKCSTIIFSPPPTTRSERFRKLPTLYFKQIIGIEEE